MRKTECSDPSQLAKIVDRPSGIFGCTCGSGVGYGYSRLPLVFPASTAVGDIAFVGVVCSEVIVLAVVLAALLPCCGCCGGCMRSCPWMWLPRGADDAAVSVSG